MRYAICSDAHGNRIFYDLCMNKIESYCVDRIIYLGDIFGYMDEGLYIKRDLINRGALVLKGNHEAMLLGELPIDSEKDKIYGLKSQMIDMNKEDFEWIKKLPEEYELETSEGKIFFIHGSAENHINGYLYEDDESYGWNEPEYRMVFMGHTHRSFFKKVNNSTIFVNVGSIGLPRDIGNRPSFCILDTSNMSVEMVNFLVDDVFFHDVFFQNVNNKVMEVLNRRWKK
ncbi:metallophosphoesterase family protein [Anaerovibrio lipolyticus]|uniref:metallophosphoesterase family protein n=1 Tax=Anaerovibrio lipolyticus TaxID=82374 RepID=UPI0004866CB1|nr:metallophosphoesterase family protein [Anaerovibrio lipolyticus]